MNPSTLIVIAYRWGWTNFSHYFVYAGPDRGKALALAQNEQADRGGKYGCAVFEFDASGEEYNLAQHFPSAYGEEWPQSNRRLDELQSLGQLLEDWQRGGGVLLPHPEKEGCLRVTEVEPVPTWLEEELQRREEFNVQVAKIHADAGLPAEVAVLPPERVALLATSPWENQEALSQATDAALEAFNGVLVPDRRIEGLAYHVAMREATETFVLALSRTAATLPEQRASKRQGGGSA